MSTRFMLSLASLGLATAALIAGCGGYGRGKGEGSGGGSGPGRSSQGTGAITRDDTNAGVSGTGRGDPTSAVSAPRASSDNNK